MRNPIAVAMQIQEVVPEDKKWVLDWCINDFSYKAPEEIGFCFRRLYEMLLQHGLLGWVLTEEWQFEVASIFSTMSIEECKRINEENKEAMNGK